MADPEDVRLLLDRKTYEAFQWGDKRPIDARRAEMRAATFTEWHLKNVDFSGADLQRANFHSATLSHVRFADASLRNALFRGTRFLNCDLKAADLSNADLTGATLVNVDAAAASLRNASLAGTSFRGINLAGADLADAQCDRTVWAGIDLRGVLNLDRIRHRGPSTVGLDTASASASQIPAAFLRGCGVPDPVIDYFQRVGQSNSKLLLHSCFISYSSKDEDFCQRLHGDLQDAGVRCWFAPDDLKTGDRFRDEIETAIRRYDKLLLVLSEHSVVSGWVATEVEGAFEREQRERDRSVLFPVRLDNAVMDTSQAWAADIRRRRQIADFSGWKDPVAYQKVFQRLLRDLRAIPVVE